MSLYRRFKKFINSYSVIFEIRTGWMKNLNMTLLDLILFDVLNDVGGVSINIVSIQVLKFAFEISLDIL